MTRFVFALLLSVSVLSPTVADNPPKPKTAGPTETGFQLPNGWHLTPAGEHLVTTDLVLNIHPLRDGRRVLVTSDGFNRHDLSLVDISGAKPKLLDRQTVHESWFGLAAAPDESKLYWSAGGQGDTHEFSITNDKLVRTSVKSDVDVSKLSKKELATRLEVEPDGKLGFTCGLILNQAGDTRVSLDINKGAISLTNMKTKEVRTSKIGGRPYDVLFGPKENLLYVSDWAGRRVLAIDPETLSVSATIPVGEHPNQMTLHKDGRLFVACASSNMVSVIDTARGTVQEVISTALFPHAPEGSTPDALTLSPDGETLYVANADNNCIAVIDVEEPRESGVLGFIPTGWYPTAVSITPDGKKLLVGVGKGLQTQPNPFFSEEELKKVETDEVKAIVKKLLPYPYIGTTLSGALSVVDVPDEAQLKQYTQQVYANCPYSDKLLGGSPTKLKSVIPSKVGEPCPIKYVIYVIKENRTYDQVLGDLAARPNPKGNGDPTLCMFPRKVTPNHHKLAEEFVLLDNLYCNGQVSRDGHPWSTMAYNTDYTARDWHLTYSRRKGIDDDDDDNLQSSPSGYIWDACKRAGVSYRSYKEAGHRVSTDDGSLVMEGRVPGLIGHMNPDFGIAKTPDSRPRDTDNVEIFLKEYNSFIKNDTMPSFIVMSLGEDHTDGTKPGRFTPEACVGSNDLALGQLVDAVSHGPLWKETAIFVIEDDAQNGPDHVDAHRTFGLVVSPYTKRKAIDSTQYSTVSMIRTMELILGLPPLSQYDAAAPPMFASFTERANLAPYTHVEAQIDLQQKNTALSYGAKRSDRMDFSEYDRIDDFELNEILWHAVMGAKAPEPPAVRQAIAFRRYTDRK